MTEQQTNLRQRALGAILVNALKSPQFLFTIAFTAALYFLVGGNVAIPNWQDWYWLVGGGLAALGFLGATVTDPEAAQEAVNKMFEQQLNLERVKNRVARQHINKALEYRTQMLELAKKSKGALRMNLLQTVEDVNSWIGHMVDLALHLDEFSDNELVSRDVKEVPGRIANVQKRIDLETKRGDASSVVDELMKQRQQLEQQMTNLQAAVNNSKRAEIQLESALASLGTRDTQM